MESNLERRENVEVSAIFMIMVMADDFFSVVSRKDGRQ